MTLVIIDPVPALELFVATIDEVRRTTFGAPVLRRMRTALQALIDELRVPTQPMPEHLARVRMLKRDVEAAVEGAPRLPPRVQRKLKPAAERAGRALVAAGNALQQEGPLQ